MVGISVVRSDVFAPEQMSFGRDFQVKFTSTFALKFGYSSIPNTIAVI